MAKVMVRTPAQISDEGFGLPETMRSLKSYALLSLRIALQTYFATSKAMEHALHVFGNPKNPDADINESPEREPWRHFSARFETEGGATPADSERHEGRERGKEPFRGQGDLAAAG
jgi:hypothetical protein